MEADPSGFQKHLLAEDLVAFSAADKLLLRRRGISHASPTFAEPTPHPPTTRPVPSRSTAAMPHRQSLVVRVNAESTWTDTNPF